MAFGSADMDITEAASNDYTGEATANALLAECRGGGRSLRTPCSSTTPEVMHVRGEKQGPTSIPFIRPWRMEHVWRKWGEEGGRRGQGFHLGHRRLRRLTWAMPEMYEETNELLMEAKFTISDADKTQFMTWHTIGPRWASSTSSGHYDINITGSTFHRQSDNQTCEQW